MIEIKIKIEEKEAKEIKNKLAKRSWLWRTFK